tara:strand:+ start:276 stop:545 length:270 start_codon:yes stop_codon:yes gene_type:complete
MDNDDLKYILLANPNHIKKETNINNYIDEINDNIFLLLNKRFPDCTLNINHQTHILSKIETICIEYTIKNILNSLIDNIINPYSLFINE